MILLMPVSLHPNKHIKELRSHYMIEYIRKYKNISLKRDESFRGFLSYIATKPFFATISNVILIRDGRKLQRVC